MKTYFIAFQTTPEWEQNKQLEVRVKSWKEVVKVATSFHERVRVSETKGYNNQGHYFNCNINKL